jgi:ribokinase
MYDFIAIGDTVTDDFIELKDVRIDTNTDEGDQGYDELCFRFGDKMQYENSVVVPAVGNSANAAVSATRLGLTTAFITDIGDDAKGIAQLEALKKNNVDTEYVSVHKGMPSNYHYVLRKGAERTILVKHNPYTYALPKNLEAPKWLYFSSVGEHGLEYHFEIAAYLKQHPETKLAFQPGTFQINLGYEKLKALYAECEVFFCNKEEAQKILGTQKTDMKELLKELHTRGPRKVVITDGPQGAYTYDGDELWFMPMYPDPAPPVDRTGAGDSFSSTFISALALGKSAPEALSWGPINSMSVVQYIGAQEGLLTPEKLEAFLKDAPEEYLAQQL